MWSRVKSRELQSMGCSTGPSNHHSQSTLRPPLPPPHNHSLSHHHSSANSLNRNSLTNRRNQIHAPAPAPNDLATTPESVQLQDSWVLNSNVPLETSLPGFNAALLDYTPHLGELQPHAASAQPLQHLIEDCSSGRSWCGWVGADNTEAAVTQGLSHSSAASEQPGTGSAMGTRQSWEPLENAPGVNRHFLFKTSSGTTPLFSSSSPGYPLTSGTVYTPPPRLLPRNTFSRNAFKLKKPSKYCSWKCAALSAIAAAVLLAILLAYFIGKAVFSLSNHVAVSENKSSADKRMVKASYLLEVQVAANLCCRDQRVRNELRVLIQSPIHAGCSRMPGIQLVSRIPTSHKLTEVQLHSQTPESQEKYELQIVDCAANPALAALLLGPWISSLHSQISLP
ncbi:hypothetical protein IHE44_0003743 [Lamprotornis superbus]|uniref:Teneurin N-terminal domain-containing protein n=1 Tax=Lamprotornis superbus TaxID=245042 RepID=A0A835NSK4_9PASS|nr:hypothetical protein IHE44_0003743 [Lamprotornis superbus]